MNYATSRPRKVRLNSDGQPSHEMTPPARTQRLHAFTRWMLPLGVLALGMMPRPSLGGPCIADGGVCRTSRSCCGASGNNGVCVIQPGAKFGACCTRTGPEVCDGLDNDCDGAIDENLGSTTCGEGECAHTVANCLGGVPQTCNPGDTDGSTCDDGDACTTVDACISGACAGGPAPNCDDGNLCTQDECLPDSGCYSFDISEYCFDDNPCTHDICDPASGCDNSEICVDHVACTVDFCDPSGQCHFFPIHPACDDGNACTSDSCDPATGCANVNNTNPCDDGDACTTDDTCASGTCVGGEAPNCDDGNPCTDDLCDTAVGCVHVNNTSPCDDGNACTTGDMCVNGACEGGPPPNCDDGIDCTIDVCDMELGCVAWPNDFACWDYLDCTLDSCDPDLGCVHEPDDVLCDDGLDCTIDECHDTDDCVHLRDAGYCGNGVCDLACGEGASNCPADCIGAGSCGVRDSSGGLF